MAPGRLALGGLVAAAAIVAVVLAGCGGGSSSAPATTGSSTTSAPPTSRPAATEPTPPKAPTAAGKKKHPPLQLPTGKPEEGPTKAQQTRVPTADVELSVGGGSSGGALDSLPAAYTCNGKGISPPLSWRNVPQGTAELAVFVASMKPVAGKLYFDWAVAGLDPSLDGLEAGQLPAGAVVGRNGAGKIGYQVCPERGPETYVFAVYALPESVSAKRGFDPLALRKRAIRMSDSVGIYTVASSAG